MEMCCSTASKSWARLSTFEGPPRSRGEDHFIGAHQLYWFWPLYYSLYFKIIVLVFLVYALNQLSRWNGFGISSLSSWSDALLVRHHQILLAYPFTKELLIWNSAKWNIYSSTAMWTMAFRWQFSTVTWSVDTFTLHSQSPEIYLAPLAGLPN